jgi:sigma-B regulation protein RsbU (phosphoserine phosphatase)
MLQAREEDIDRITELFHRVLKGEIPQPISLPADVPDNELRQVVEYANRFATEYHALADAMSAVSRGELDFDVPMGRMHVLQSFKNLHANLRHLTWKTQQIAGGDLSQHIDFMGDFSQAFNSMTQQLKEAFARIDRQNQDLADANQRMKRDLDAAASMQRDLLPKALPDLLGARFSWFYEPCDELGGDILNVLPLDDRHIGMYLLDVSGHGVPAVGDDQPRPDHARPERIDPHLATAGREPQ